MNSLSTFRTDLCMRANLDASPTPRGVIIDYKRSQTVASNITKLLRLAIVWPADVNRVQLCICKLTHIAPPTLSLLLFLERSQSIWLLQQRAYHLPIRSEMSL